MSVHICRFQLKSICLFIFVCSYISIIIPSYIWPTMSYQRQPFAGWCSLPILGPIDTWKIYWYIYVYIYNIYIYIYIRGACDYFPDFFRMGIYIVVDSWTFSKLLLYVYTDDWPIFRISASNQQLQQELEYTLLKPDCHSWWISKMQSDTLEKTICNKITF